MVQSTLEPHGALERDAFPSALEIPSSPTELVEALLKTPRTILHAAQGSRGMLLRLAGLTAGTCALAGFALALFSGGMQLVYVPLKAVAGIFFASLLCFPSLHVFSCLSGAEQRARDKLTALLMGTALTGILLVGFAPIAWVFSQATSSTPVVGAVHMAFLLAGCWLGASLVHRSLAAMNPKPLGRIRMWSALFVLVILQMTTTLRPLVGPSDGAFLHPRLFFGAHWIESVAR
jgi:hypothetical protein